MKNLVVSGYKSTELGIFKENDPRVTFIKAAIEKRLISCIEEGLEWIIITGQLGVEMWTAEVVLDLKENYNINIAMIPPFENQENRWPDPLKEKYQELTFVVDFFQPLYKGEYKGPYQFQAKNKWLVEKSDGCLLLMDEDNPGSNKYLYDIVKEKKGYNVYLITPMDLEDIVEEIRMNDPDYWG
ncbi:SLOG family protein [Oceanobacillus sp. Castelsardo]|uniref:SLOG family protein n=1 Tax=Oceanobacillus sp. Castelsardo TaxID=1851204 RepID=UPI0008395502|nr:DUF1273 domain-containing protein [Oceanobacillus sp. Castelsardo]